MRDFVASAWVEVLKHNRVNGFDAVWALGADWLEPPNVGRGGWSGVARCEFELPDSGELIGVYVKRQENHTTRTWRHPLRGVPTLAREFCTAQRYLHIGLPTAPILYYGQRRGAGTLRAALLSRELSGFDPLDIWTERWSRQGRTSLRLRRRSAVAVAQVLARMHRHHLQHNSCYPKHIFLRVSSPERIEVSIIDLEKTRWRLLGRTAMLRDLDTLNRHCDGWSRTDRLRFLLAYLGAVRVTPRVRRVWHTLAQRAERKQRRRAMREGAQHAR